MSKPFSNVLLLLIWTRAPKTCLYPYFSKFYFSGSFFYQIFESKSTVWSVRLNTISPTTDMSVRVRPWVVLLTVVDFMVCDLIVCYFSHQFHSFIAAAIDCNLKYHNSLKLDDACVAQRHAVGTTPQFSQRGHCRSTTRRKIIYIIY